MASVNKVILIGNLVRDPELKYLPNGNTAVCDIGLAVNRTWTDANGQKKEEVTFVDCSSFGKQAETLNKYVKKGQPLYVEGRLKLDQWEAQDGSKRTKMRVVIENFQFLASKPQQAQGYTDEMEVALNPRSASTRAAMKDSVDRQTRGGRPTVAAGDHAADYQAPPDDPPF